MIYVVDTNSLSQLFRAYFESRFPTLWKLFDEMIAEMRLTSTREVRNELKQRSRSLRLDEWVAAHPEVFPAPTEREMEYVRTIFTNRHFRDLVSQKSLLSGTPVADPFVVARAWAIEGTVVTEEEHKPNAAKIPNVCDAFGVRRTNLEGMMEAERWEF